VECNVCREAVSARADGEREPVPAEQVDRHLADCADCAGWSLTAVESTRRLRVRTVTATPDLTAVILDRLDADGPIAETARRRGVHVVLGRALLAVFGLRRRAVDPGDPVALPPGARYGRRLGHLRAGHDPAA
jgi:predicted anti-sigma-YlaC factor YlaD